jgi:hypothetical protein
MRTVQELSPSGTAPLERDTLLAHLRPTALSVKTVLFEPGEAIESVHFPLDGVTSLVTPSADGSVEVAIRRQRQW